METVVIHYHEIGLKGKNRSFFEKYLLKRIRFSLKGIPFHRLRKERARILVEFMPETIQEYTFEEIQNRLQKVCGIANFARGIYTQSEDFNQLCETIGKEVFHLQPTSFAVRTKRSDPFYPLTSPEINERVGAYVQKNTRWPVNLSHPDLTIQIEMLKKTAFFHTKKIPGPGGLPIGVSGQVLCLLSGGIDSPVAAYRFLKRGCHVNLLHFHSFPFTNQASMEKVRDLARILAQHRYSPTLYMVPFSKIQQEIVAKTPAPYRVVLYRRFMSRIAEKQANKIDALALVSGESLAQVASQTLKNLVAIQKVLTIPILRPLIGMDKEEIIMESRKLGTYETSIQPHEDCCSYLMPKKPVTHSYAEKLDEIESVLEVEKLVNETLDQIESEKL